MTGKIENLTSFGEAALALDREFLELEKLAKKIERLSLQSDQGVERVVSLINEAEEARERLMNNMQTMASALEDARGRSEAAIRTISERAVAINERQRTTEKLAARFQQLGEMVRQINAAMAQLKPAEGAISAEQRALLEQSLPDFNNQMNVLVEEAKKIMAEAAEANLVSIQRNADSLRQALDAARQRLNLLAHKPEAPSSHELH